MIILGMNAYHGDASACLVVDGRLVVVAEEERFRRVKHWVGFPAEEAKKGFRGFRSTSQTGMCPLRRVETADRRSRARTGGALPGPDSDNHRWSVA